MNEGILIDLFVNSSESEIVALVEDMTSYELDVVRTELTDKLSGFLLVYGKKARIFIDERLPFEAQRRVFLHEIYHLLMHRRGHYFWSAMTLINPGFFEKEADDFADRILSLEAET